MAGLCAPNVCKAWWKVFLLFVAGGDWRARWSRMSRIWSGCEIFDRVWVRGATP